ncbi:hypothetical protein SO802_013614 [Lithocarpus litseifolius]|uniref:Uncharacterized protein n=1 Tax=Lithocarpus litseifolius TaxID=425828 RepID=A0AAW2D8R1_9ROSI
MFVIDIILYHGGPLKNANANKGLPFEGPGIKFYYTEIDRRLKTVDELKMIVMEELCANPAIHNIQITYCMTYEVSKHRINYKYMAIETDKHVKIMFNKLERIPEVHEVGIEKIQQTTTSLQVTVSNAQYEYYTHVEDDDVHDDDDDDYANETTTINDEDFVDRD